MSPEALPGAPGSLKRRMAEREADRMESLRRGLAEQITRDEWDAPKPPAALRQSTSPDLSQADRTTIWKRLQAAQGQQRADEQAGTAPYSFVAPPKSSADSIELFLTGKIGLWEALFGTPYEVYGPSASSESSQMPARERRIQNTSPTGRGRINTTKIPAGGAAGHVPLFGPAMDLTPLILGPGPSGPPGAPGENPLGRPGNPDDASPTGKYER